MKFGGDGVSKGQFKHATGIAVDANGNIFVADYEAKRIQKFDAGGNVLAAWFMGTDIKVKGTPEAIAVDANGNVYVTDYDLGRMQVFDNNGEFLWAWGDGSLTNAPFKRPVGIAFDTSGRIYVTNQSGGNVLVFNLP